MNASSLQVLRDQLHRVHAVFLEALKYRYERSTGQPLNPSGWFYLIMHNPDYAWVKPFTALLTEIDILLEEELISTEQELQIRQKARELFSAEKPENDFGTRFFAMLPQEPEILVTYHPLREALRFGPKPST